MVNNAFIKKSSVTESSIKVYKHNKSVVAPTTQGTLVKDYDIEVTETSIKLKNLPALSKDERYTCYISDWQDIFGNKINGIAVIYPEGETADTVVFSELNIDTDNNTASVSCENYNSSETAVEFILAGYDSDGKLVEMTSAAENVAGMNSKKIKLNPLSSISAFYKAYIWNDNMKPYINPLNTTLIGDSDFESGIADFKWYNHNLNGVYAVSDMGVTNKESYSGNMSMYLTLTDTDYPHFVTGKQYLKQMEAMGEGTYKLSFMAKAEKQPVSMLGSINGKRRDGKAFQISKRVNVGTEWTEFEMIVDTREYFDFGNNNTSASVGEITNASVTLQIDKTATDKEVQNLYIDDIKLVPVEVTPIVKTRTPRLYLIGDSIIDVDVKGWGNRLAKFYDCDNLKVVNVGRGGWTTDKFFNGARDTTLAPYPRCSDSIWGGVVSTMKEGDYAIISLGTNDANDHVSMNVPLADYKANLQKMVDDIKAVGVEPIFVTSIPRNGWVTSSGEDATSNTARATLLKYIAAMKNIAQTNNVNCYDLNSEVVSWMKEETLAGTAGNMFWSDGLHLEEKYSIKVARKVAEFLNDTFEIFKDNYTEREDSELSNDACSSLY